MSYFVEVSELNANSVDPNQTPQFAASDLGLHCLPISLLWHARHIWVKTKKNIILFKFRKTVKIPFTNFQVSFEKKNVLNENFTHYRQKKANTILNNNTIISSYFPYQNGFSDSKENKNYAHDEADHLYLHSNFNGSNICHCGISTLALLGFVHPPVSP